MSEIETLAANELHILRAAAVDGKDFRGLPREQSGSDPESGGDALSAAMLMAMEFILRHVSAKERAAMGLILGTTLGSLEIDREFDRSRRPAEGRFASPAAFSRTLPSTVAAEIALRFGVTGPSMVVSAGDCSAAIALRRAAAWMDRFGLNFCAAGAMDWTGSRVGERESYRAAVLLLGRAAEHPVGLLRVSAFVRPNLAATWDKSLDCLAAWTAETVDMDLGGGVQLLKTRLPAVAGGR